MQIATMSAEQVILVDAQDNEIGLMEKQEAHQKGALHRAFSIFVFNTQGELLLQRRAYHKYHSGGLWTNTCCSHPRPGERLPAAANRRLQEEMGFDCALERAFSFLYHQAVGELIEHELDHVFIGVYDGDLKPDAMEVAEWKAISLPDLQADMAIHPEHYTIWFRLCLERVLAYQAGNGPQEAGQISYLS